MDSVANLLRAIAVLAWPAVLIYLLVRYHKEIPQVLGRVTKIQGPAAWR